MTVTWNTVDQELHVASRAGDFVGYVDTTARGEFVAFDEFSTPIGKYPTLPSARDAVVGALTKPAPSRLPAVAATVTGTIASGLMLTAGALAPHL